MIFYSGGRMGGKATWSKILNGNLAPNLVIARMFEEGYKVVQTYAPCPVKGHVPHGSIVITEYRGRPAKWIGGVIFQKEDKMWEEESDEVDEEEEWTEDDEYNWETDTDFWDDEEDEDD